MSATLRPTLRPATPADLPAIQAIVHDAYGPYVSRIGRPPGPMGDDYAALVAASRVTVLERGGAVQALLVLVPEASAMLLDNVAVAPAAQRTGLGALLLAHAEQAARQAGLPAIRLYTNKAMTENIALYARLGYVETHRAEQNGLHRVFMTKTLD